MRKTDPKKSLPKSHQPTFLVGGWTNPFEKYARQNGNLPQIGLKMKNIWNHHPVLKKNAFYLRSSIFRSWSWKIDFRWFSSFILQSYSKIMAFFYNEKNPARWTWEPPKNNQQSYGMFFASMDFPFQAKQCSGQIALIPKPKLRAILGGIPLKSPPFGGDQPAGTGRYNLARMFIFA